MKNKERKKEMVDLTAKPFYLGKEEIEWVEEQITGMTLEEKIGQLFIIFNQNRDPGYIKKVCNQYHVGGLRWMGGTLEEVYEQNRYYQECSKIPLLIAANCETGGNGAVGEGTIVATNAACGACATTEGAYDMGYVSGIEAAAIGCNWNFAPVSDLFLNWRNTIVNTRCFSNDPDINIEMCKAYIRGVHNQKIACCTKHFPGDGSEERDQHLLMGCNDLSCEEWDATYGKVYQALIDDGLESIMAGQICQPAYTRKFHPEIKDEEIKPATLSPELLQNLLRGQLGFNGLIVTDASHMAGLTCSCPRSEQVPGTIAAGCDMFLFFHDPEEDLRYMMEGYKNGIITEERLSDALHRILGMKAHLGLHKLKFPPKEGLKNVGCEEHHRYATKTAKEAITLVKDNQKILPVNPEEKKRAKLYFVESEPASILDGTDPAKHIVKEELEKAGFEVTLHENFYEMERNHPSHANKGLIRKCESVEELKANYDIIFVFIHMKGYAQENNTRIKWSAGHSNEIPWYTADVPTVCVSLNYTNHLIDVPMFKTFINAYCPTKEYIHETVRKIIGEDSFRGHYNETVWCGRWDTRL